MKEKWILPSEETKKKLKELPDSRTPVGEVVTRSSVIINAYKSDLSDALDKLKNLCDAARALDGLNVHSEDFRRGTTHLFVQVENAEKHLTKFRKNHDTKDSTFQAGLD